MIYLCNTFTPHMLERMSCGQTARLDIKRISAAEAGRLLRDNAFRSFFGHSGSAYHLERYLHVTIPVCRGAVTLHEDDLLLVASIESKRLWEQGYKGCPGWKFYLFSNRKKGDRGRKK